MYVEKESRRPPCFDLSAADWLSGVAFPATPSLQHSPRRQPIELNEAERIAPTLISEQHEEAAYRFPKGRIPGFISCRALRQLRPARSQSRYLRWVRVVDHVQDAAEPATRHFHLTRLDTHIAGGAGFAWPAVLRRGCTPARQTEVNRGDLPRSHWPDQNLTLLLLTRYTSVFCGSCSLLCSLSILSRAGGCRPAPIGAARSDPGKPLSKWSAPWSRPGAGLVPTTTSGWPTRARPGRRGSSRRSTTSPTAWSGTLRKSRHARPRSRRTPR